MLVKAPRKVKRPLEHSAGGILPLVDMFTDDRRGGGVIGSRSPSGMIRRGCDVERQIAIDNGALRLRPLITPGWGRQGLAYGPYRRVAGLTMAISITNGHNTSESVDRPERFRSRLWRWLLGSQDRLSVARFLRWLRSPQKKGIGRRLRWWLTNSSRLMRRPVLKENLALGWFATEAPQDPLVEGAAFVVHAAYGENGELWARVCGRPLAAFRRLQNLRLHYVVALRERGAAYYVSSLPGAHGVAAFPSMRPVAIDPSGDGPEVYAGVFQSVLGQIAFRVDTRVHGIKIAAVPELAAWYGTAHAADALVGAGDLDGSPAEVGGAWRVLGGRYSRTAGGARADEAGALAVLEPGAPSGLVHVRIEPGPGAQGAIGLVWRLRDARNYWMLRLSHEGCELILVLAGVRSTVAQDGTRSLPREASCSVQILDGHGQLGLYLDGARLFDGWLGDRRLRYSTGVGFCAEQVGGPLVRAFEAHPASVPIPKPLLFAPPWAWTGERVMAADSFAGEAGDLDGRVAEQGGRTWRKDLGQGAIELTGNGAARVRASCQSPNPGRLIYTIPWQDHDLADIETTIIPPEGGRGRGERCRAGLVLWQDESNYLTFSSYLDDSYNGASVALFSHLNGFEELYDAIWTMVWTKIVWGKPFRLRVAFDAGQFVVFLDQEPVLQRAITDLYPRQPPLRITRVGLVANWEWGDDTGSRFGNFVGRA
jgi:hypothetical protein